MTEPYAPGDPLAAEMEGARDARRLAVRRFLRHRFAVAGSLFMVLLLGAAVLAPHLSPYSPIETNLAEKLSPPSLTHFFGTEYFGRDVFSRVIYGARTSLLVGLMVVVIAIGVGTPVGLLAGYVGGRLDNLLMRLMDAFLSFPPFLLAVAVMGTLGPEIQNVMIALGLVYIPVFARLVRANTLTVREQDYVQAARAVGVSDWRILLLHILPNLAAPVVVQAAVTFARAILAEASLSFLGLGAQPPDPSWGRDLNEARRYMTDAWWLITFPTLVMGLSVLSMNFIGDGLRDALDPSSGEG